LHPVLYLGNQRLGVSLIEKRNLSNNYSQQIPKTKVTISATNHLIKKISKKNSKGYNLVEIKKLKHILTHTESES